MFFRVIDVLFIVSFLGGGRKALGEIEAVIIVGIVGLCFKSLRGDG